MTRLVFVCGHAGSGKTTLAKRLVHALREADGTLACLLDKDTLYGRYSSAVMNALTHDPDDRDSPLFLEHLRDPEYLSLIDTARENLELGVSVIVVAPLSREVRERRLFDRAWLGIGLQVALDVVWVHVDETIARERIVARDNRGDAWKLAHWDEYRQRRFMPEGANLEGLLTYDSGKPGDDEFTALLARLAGGR